MDISELVKDLRRGGSAPPALVSSAPYVYRAYPKWKYAQLTVGDPMDAVLVQNDAEDKKLGDLWGDSPEDAKRRRDRLDEYIAQCAAERAWDDRRLGEKARAELTAHEQQATEHVLDVPVIKDSK